MKAPSVEPPRLWRLTLVSRRLLNLAGWFFPLNNNRGTVLACHGVGANRADILEFIVILQDAGFQVLCFDFRGHGESDGHTVSYGFRERQDVLGAWDHLMTRPDVDPNRIYGFGLDDVTIPPDCTRILFDGYGGPKKLRLEPGAGHGGTAGMDTARYRRELRAFFLGQGNE